MNTLQAELVEKEVVKIIAEYCESLDIQTAEPIDANFIPGKYIKSHVLLTAIEDLAFSLHVTIPVECYIFFEKKERRQLSIGETVAKILNVAENEK